ncbi:MAG TPA: nucleoside 2-deoxyribosyltransferase, partial [Longimicrobiales bacterium]
MSAHRYHVLVLMPFARAYDGLFDFIKAAAARADAEAQRVDKEHFEGEIMAQLVGDIESADAIVAVLTGKNPNVYFEVGFAYALGKHLVLLTADKKLP